MTNDENWFEWSSQTLEAAVNFGQVAINPIIFAEISVGFSSMDEVVKLLAPTILLIEHIPFEAAFLAGKCHSEYRKRGGVRTSPLPDFFIGAHASVAGYTLITRDAARYRTYFPNLKVVAPE